MKSGYTPVRNDILMIWAKGIIIKSGITDNIFRGILDGPVDLFSKELMMSNISSLAT